jgi:Putative Flp pilus-assembly TadE/G-like
MLNFVNLLSRSSRSRLRREEGGQVIALMVISLVAVIGIAAYVVDVGNFYRAHRELQADADAAALAAAQNLPDAAAATATAQQYSGTAGDKNANSNLTGVTTSVSTKCISGIPCNPVNTIVVTETATVPSIFAKVLGIGSATITAKATAASNGGQAKPLHVMLLVDRSASMNNSCSAGGTKLTCAQSAIKTFLGLMLPSQDKVGLALMPPPKTLAKTCSRSTSDLSYDNPSTPTVDPNYPYVVVPLSTDYRTSDTGPLNNSSSLVSTVNCFQAPGGHGSSFATAIDKVQAYLAANNDPAYQNVIIFLGDGLSNYGPVYYDNPVKNPEKSPYRLTPCHQTITSAQNAYAAGTQIYAIAYDTSGGGNCNGWQKGTDSPQQTTTFSGTESPTISGTQTMQGVAQPSTNYYNQPTAAQLTTIFTQIAIALTGPALVDDNRS